MNGWTKIIVALVCLSPIFAADGTETEVIDEIIAKVNGQIITRGDLDRIRRDTVAALEKRQTPEAEAAKILADREQNMLRDRIDHLLLVQRGEMLDINVDQEVSKYFADIMLQMKIADQDKFAEAVRQSTGLRFEDYREEVKEGILTQRVLSQEVGSRVNVPQEDIQKYYEEHKSEFTREERVFLLEILVSTDGKMGDELAAAEKKAQALVERARRGEKFDELARENSDAVTAESGGDLGGWKKGDLRADIEAMIWDKEKNYVTDPIKTDSGYLILKVVAHHQAGLAHFEEVEQEITARLHAPLFQPKVREYLTDLRQMAYLEIKDGYVDSAPAPGKDTSWNDPARLLPETVTRDEVIARPGRKKFLFIPIPGTSASPKSSSK